jgi:hypothetical protein
MHPLKKHSHKLVTYSIIGVISLFILVASLWYRSQRIAEKQAESKSIETLYSQRKETAMNEKADAYEVEVAYPLFVAEGAEGANATIRSMYRQKVQDFIAGAKGTFVESQKYPDAPKGPSTYTSSFETVSHTDRYISLLSTEQFYTIGAAHPAHFRLTFIFDTMLKKLVEPSELFIASSTYLSTLSTLSREAFDERKKANKDVADIDTSSANSGFDPTESNFSKILPTTEGLVIYFDEYQIGTYVDGPQEITIPYNKLKSVLNKDGVLGEYFRK